MANKKDGVEELVEEACVITKELIQMAIRSKEGKCNLNVKEYTVQPGSVVGENYLSIALKVNATTECKDGEKAHQLFVKVMHRNPLLKELTVKNKIFYKEEMAYSKIIPDMICYQKQRGIEPVWPSVPSFYYSSVDDDTALIILEDLTIQGYVSADRRKGLNYEACKLVMEELGIFHSLSYAMKEENPDNLKKYRYLFHDALVCSTMPRYLKTGLNASLELVKNISDDPQIRQSVDKINMMDIGETLNKLLEPIEPYALICHGDVWCNNMLFKYDKCAENPTPVDVKLFDLQVVRYALPTTDLAYFFYTNTTKATRDKHLNDLLGIYHRTFMDSLNKLNIPIPGYNFGTLKRLFRESALFGILMTCMLSRALLTKPENATRFTGSSEADVHQRTAKFYKEMSENPENQPIIKHRLLGAIEDVVEMGLI